MKETEYKPEVTAEKSGGGQTFGSFVFALSLKTIMAALVFFSLAVSVFSCLFPRVMLDHYRAIGDFRKAAQAADIIVNTSRGSDGYLAALGDAIGLYDIVLSSETHSKPHTDTGVTDTAGRLFRHAKSYLSEDGHEQWSKQLDDYYVRQYSKSSQMTILSLLYGYNSYVIETFVYSGSIAGETETAQPLSAKDMTIRICALNAYLAFSQYAGKAQYPCLTAEIAALPSEFAAYLAEIEGQDVYTGGAFDREKVAKKLSAYYSCYKAASGLAKAAGGIERDKGISDGALTAYFTKSFYESIYKSYTDLLGAYTG